MRSRPGTSARSVWPEHSSPFGRMAFTPIVLSLYRKEPWSLPRPNHGVHARRTEPITQGVMADSVTATREATLSRNNPEGFGYPSWRVAVKQEHDRRKRQRCPRCEPRAARAPLRGQRVQRPGTSEDVPKPATKKEEKIWWRTSATSHDPGRQLELDLDV